MIYGLGRLQSRKLSYRSLRLALQDHNFGLKSGGNNSEGERGALSPGTTGGEWEDRGNHSHPTLGSDRAS